MSKVFCIDAGHGGKDAGAVNGGLYEKASALATAKLLKKELEAKGHEVIMTRDSDTFLELSERCTIANKANVNAFISIHCNSAENKDAHGIETWFCTGSVTGEQLAKAVQAELIDSTGANDRCIKPGTFYVLKNTKAPAILVETGFISNEEEKILLFKTYYQEKMVKAIAEGVLNVLT